MQLTQGSGVFYEGGKKQNYGRGNKKRTKHNMIQSIVALKNSKDKTKTNNTTKYNKKKGVVKSLRFCYLPKPNLAFT